MGTVEIISTYCRSNDIIIHRDSDGKVVRASAVTKEGKRRLEEILAQDPLKHKK